MSLSGHHIQSALTLWPQTHSATARLISHSENQIFELTNPAGQRFTLRVHRNQYQSPAAIDSELAWLTALHADTGLPIPRPLPGLDGKLLQVFRSTKGERHHAVLFDYITGIEPAADTDLAHIFGTLGHYAAVLHDHATRWQRPSFFERPVWQVATILPPDAPWGDWRIAPGVSAYNRPILDVLSQTLTDRLAAYGTAPNRFGLIHADMRLGNLLVDGNSITLIDFDDCGFSWFLFDFAAAISFHETNPTVPDLKARWLDAYCAIRPLDAPDVAMIDTLIMLRRMALLAWIGSHSETRLAQTHTHGFAENTAVLAERYLSGALYP